MAWACFCMQMLYERMEREAAETDEPESEARRRAMEEEEALLKVALLVDACEAPSLGALSLSKHLMAPPRDIRP